MNILQNAIALCTVMLKKIHSCIKICVINFMNQAGLYGCKCSRLLIVITDNADTQLSCKLNPQSSWRCSQSSINLIQFNFAYSFPV